MKLRGPYLRLGLVAALSAFSITVNAAAILSSQGSVAFYNSSDQQIGSSTCFTFSATGALVGCSGSAAIPSTGGTLNYLTSAYADYGVLKVFGQSSISNPSGPSGSAGPSYSRTSGQASFRDQWTITGQTAGTLGTLQLRFHLDGSYDFSQVNTGVMTGFSLVNLTSSTFSNGTPSLVGNVGSISTDVLLTTQFVYGTQFDFLVNLLGGSVLHNLEGGGTNGLSSFMDLSDTALMNAIIVRDAAGNVLPFNLTTVSGAGLFSALAPGIPTDGRVPEPETLLLLGIGLFGLAATHRKRKAI